MNFTGATSKRRIGRHMEYSLYTTIASGSGYQHDVASVGNNQQQINFRYRPPENC